MLGNFVSKLKPSVVAASAFLAASSYLYPEKYPSFYGQMMLEGIFKEVCLIESLILIIKHKWIDF